MPRGKAALKATLETLKKLRLALIFCLCIYSPLLSAFDSLCAHGLLRWLLYGYLLYCIVSCTYSVYLYSDRSKGAVPSTLLLVFYQRFCERLKPIDALRSRFSNSLNPWLCGCLT